MDSKILFLKFSNLSKLIGLILSLMVLISCGNDNSTLNRKKSLVVGVSADYPPFEFRQNHEFKGLDIEIAKLIGRDLGKKVEFKDLTFNNLFLALNSGQIDLAISTITYTDERAKSFDLSIPYYFSDLVILFRKDKTFKDLSDLKFKKIGVQLGSTMEIWAKTLTDVNLITMDLNLQLIEALKSQQINFVITEHAQAKQFCRKNPSLAYLVVHQVKNGYVVALKKKSKLLPLVNAALAKILKQDEFARLKREWLELLVDTQSHEFD